ncbi:MAG: flagellar motor switch phosphatase FliY [Bacillota bacterium]|nr:flagellar motor switch phosphatase FliY [Bacillota bacterium]
MGDMLSQAEIDALLNGTPVSSEPSGSNQSVSAGAILSSQEIDALGEIGNIGMGTSATTLFTLLGQKVLITTPRVTVTSWDEMSKAYSSSMVAVRVEYTHGLIGTNLLIMKESDVKVITDLMMGGDGTNISGELTDLHLSAISEAMNQMVGSASTSMSSMFGSRIDISPPKAFSLKFDENAYNVFNDDTEQIVKIAFKMVVGDLIDSEIMQLLPLAFAKELVDNLLNMDMGNTASQTPQSQPKVQQQTPVQQPKPQQQSSADVQQYRTDTSYGIPEVDQGSMNFEPPRQKEHVNVQPAQFQSFDDSRMILEKKNISLIMDVPLQVTVELGRTHKLIREILEFGPGSIIELDKLAGEPVDILVNGKPIAKGEVVVIDESFGVRITDIIHPSKRL